jgi:hypothetical protein
MIGNWTRSYTIGPDHVPMPCFDILEWGLWMQANRALCRVGDDRRDNYRVSTVFLALDHCWGSGDPVLFETMVFFDDGELGVMERYCTWAEAAAGHERIRAMLARESMDAEKMTLATLRTLMSAAATVQGELP